MLRITFDGTTLPVTGRVSLCSYSGKRNFQPGQNWEKQKIRGIIYLEKAENTSQGHSEKITPPPLCLRWQEFSLLCHKYIYLYVYKGETKECPACAAFSENLL